MHPKNDKHICLEESQTSHPDNSIPEEPPPLPNVGDGLNGRLNASASPDSFTASTGSSTITDQNDTPATESSTSGLDISDLTLSSPSNEQSSKGQAQERALVANALRQAEPLDAFPSSIRGAQTKELGKICCGGGCCFQSIEAGSALHNESNLQPLEPPANDAFKSLNIRLGALSLETKLNGIAELPPESVYFDAPKSEEAGSQATPCHTPSFVTPHPPYEVFSSRVRHARELTKPGALKRTYHFDLDVTDYPPEGGDVDFVVGGAIGVQPPNATDLVEEVFDLLGIPRPIRDRKIELRTTGGRWPTIWGDEMHRRLTTTRRELLTWCSDIQSYPPTKQLLRVLGEYCTDPTERKILDFLVSAQGQGAFCDLRTGPHIVLAQLLRAFPSSQPPLHHLLAVLSPILPRLYSLSHDPQTKHNESGGDCRRLIEVAVTVHESAHWQGGTRIGLGSGYLERVAKDIISASKSGKSPDEIDLRVPIFRGLMSNPLAREFVTDGPMLLIGAGVGIAPFRGFVQRRLKAANCANKVWVLQGVRDSLLDELYGGEWGVDEEKLKTVVQSRRGIGRYVQEEVRHQADLVWFVINSLDGRIFVCGGSDGMGKGVENALVDVAMDKGNLRHEEAQEFWSKKRESNQYIVV